MTMPSCLVLLLERLIALSEPFIRRGQLCLDAHTLKLSPQGVFTSDGIIAELFD